jgi:hypothetical protein
VVSDASIMALIAMVGTGIGLLFQSMSRRDQLKYDVKLAVLEEKQKICEQNDAAKSVRIASLEAHIVTLTATDVKDRIELEAQIKKKDDAPAHVPLDPDKR